MDNDDDIRQIEDDSREALKSFISELETSYYPWYDKATTRTYYAWFAAQGLSLVSGFGTAVLAAVMREDQFRAWSAGRVALVILPLLGALATTFLVQSRIVELEALREQGRETIQNLTNQARVDFAAASSAADYTEIHRRLVSDVSALEQQQSRGFLRIIPKALSFRASGSTGASR